MVFAMPQMVTIYAGIPELSEIGPLTIVDRQTGEKICVLAGSMQAGREA